MTRTPAQEKRLKQALDTYIAADDAWQTCLEAHFGEDAGDARYDSKGQGDPGTELRALYDAYHAANVAWHALRDPLYALEPEEIAA